MNVNLAIVKELVRYECNIDVFAPDVNQPIFIAISRGLDDIGVFLIDSGCNLNILHATLGKTPLMIALDKKYYNLAATILDSPNCDVNFPDAWGDTALYNALHANSIEDVLTLIESNANVNIRGGGYGHSILMKACMLNNIPLVWKLIDYEVDPNMPNKDGSTPFNYCIQKKYNEIAKNLLLCGADPNLKDSSNLNAAELAQAVGNIEMLVLIQALSLSTHAANQTNAQQFNQIITEANVQQRSQSTAQQRNQVTAQQNSQIVTPQRNQVSAQQNNHATAPQRNQATTSSCRIF